MFILSKIFAFLLNPLLWIIVLVLWAIIAKNKARKKRIYISALVLFIIFSNPYLFIVLFNQLQARKIELTHGENFSAGILLGGFVSHDERNNQSHFNISSDRFIQTARLYKQGHIRKIIITGGNALGVKGDFPEARFAAENLAHLGIPSEDIIAETRSRNTFENAGFSKHILDSLQLPGPFILITSAFHIPRATVEFERAGLSVRPYPCAYLLLPSDSHFTLEKLIPSAQALSLWPLYLKEILGLVMLRMRG